MFASQRIACLRVVETLLIDAGGFPVHRRVASRAIWPKPPLVLVFVARSATGRKSHPRAPKVFSSEKRPRRCRDVLGGVACAAAYACVLAIENVSRLQVIKSFGRGVPMDHLKVHTVVVGVAFDAGSTGRARSGKRGMKPPILLKFRRYFLVAFKAVKRWRMRGDLVALDAVRVAIEALVGFRQRSRRNLGMQRHGKNGKNDGQERAQSCGPGRGCCLQRAQVSARAHPSDPCIALSRISFSNSGTAD